MAIAYTRQRLRGVAAQLAAHYRHVAAMLWRITLILDNTHLDEHRWLHRELLLLYQVD